MSYSSEAKFAPVTEQPARKEILTSNESWRILLTGEFPGTREDAGCYLLGRVNCEGFSLGRSQILGLYFRNLALRCLLLGLDLWIFALHSCTCAFGEEVSVESGIKVKEFLGILQKMYKRGFVTSLNVICYCHQEQKGKTLQADGSGRHRTIRWAALPRIRTSTPRSQEQTFHYLTAYAIHFYHFLSPTQLTLVHRSQKCVCVFVPLSGCIGSICGRQAVM